MATKKKKASSKPELPQIEISSAAELGRWLAEHHTSATGVWVTFFKKHHKNHVEVRALVDEALCFGWIDSTLRRVDEDRTTLRFTPRKPRGDWSANNKAAVVRLEKAGRMTDAGRAAIEVAKKNGAWTFLDDVDARVVPVDLAAALRAKPKAKQAFDALPPGRQKDFLYWIKTAKAQKTRDKRIAETVQHAVAGTARAG